MATTQTSSEPDAGNLCHVCGKRPADAMHIDKGGASIMCGPCHDSVKVSYGCKCAACTGREPNALELLMRDGAAALRRIAIETHGLCPCGKEPATATHLGSVGDPRKVCPDCHEATKRDHGCRCDACVANGQPKHKATKGGGTMAAKKAKAKAKGVIASTFTSSAKVDPSAPIERARYKEKLPCAIDEAIAHEAGDELAKIIQERAVFLERRKAENTKARERRALYDETIEELGAKISTRSAVRDVEVIEYLHPTERKIVVVRADTGETISNKSADDDDLQTSLLDATGKPVPKGANGARASSDDDDLDLGFEEAGA